MSDNQKLIRDLEDLLSAPVEERYKKFLSIIAECEKFHQLNLTSVKEFDKVHNDLLDLLVVDEYNGALIDRSKYEKFELIMMDLRRLIETLIIEHYVQAKRMDDLSMKFKDLQNETNDLKQIVYETEYKKLSYAISTPLKRVLTRRFRNENIRMDPLNETLLLALFENNHDFNGLHMSEKKFHTVFNIYKDISDTIGIYYKNMLKMLMCRNQRNIEQHEMLEGYVQQCKRSGIQSDFTGLMNYLQLAGLQKYKDAEMKVLEKVFHFYLIQDEYR